MTTAQTTRKPRKPARASTGDSGTTTPQTAPTGRRRASTKTKPTASSNRFDGIASAVAKGDDDLARQLSASIGKEKAKPAISRRAARKVGKELATERQATARQAKPKPTAPDNGKTAPAPKATAPKATGNGVAFKGRPTTKVETVGARVKQAGLRVRATADVDQLAARLRATPEAVRAWLDSRNGSAPAAPKATTKAPAKSTDKAPATAKPKEPKAPTITVGHAFEGPPPKSIPELKGSTLVLKYTALDDGTVQSQLWTVKGSNGEPLPDFWQLPLDFRPTVETLGNGRKVHLKAPTKEALRDWLDAEGLTDATP